MDEWTDSIRIAVDLLVACVIIAALLTCMMLGGRISNYMDLSHAAAAEVKDFRVDNMYGGDVYPQDIVNLILESQGYPYVCVFGENDEGDVVERCKYNQTSRTTALTSEMVSIAISKHHYDATKGHIVANDADLLNDVFTCKIVRENGDTGDVMGYEFTAK